VIGGLGDRQVSVAEAAEWLGRSVGWVRARCRSGQLPAMKLGRDWRIDPADVRALMTPGVTMDLGLARAIVKRTRGGA
jgi:excisionase family DNA binding protein